MVILLDLKPDSGETGVALALPFPGRSEESSNHAKDQKIQGVWSHQEGREG